MAPNMVIFATSNFPQAIDPAFLSRVDLTLDIPIPDRSQVLLILDDALSEVATEITTYDLDDAVVALEGISGREIRKVVIEAIIAREAAVDEPLTEKELCIAINGRRGGQ